jgi:AraC family transcriptional regulator
MLPEGWQRKVLSLQNQGITIRHTVADSYELHNDGGMTEHLLAFVFEENPRQVNRFDGKEFDGSNIPGDLCLVPANVPSFHYCEHLGEFLSFCIDPVYFKQIVEQNDCLQSERLEIKSLLHFRDPQITTFATLFRDELYNGGLGSRLYIESLANLFLIHVLRQYCSQTLITAEIQDGLSCSQLHQALEYIQAHLTTEVTLQKIAMQLGMSQYYFCRLFKQSMGVSPYQYVLSQRIELVKRLLRQDRESAIADIALDCGFSNQSQMTYHFHKLTGVTPKTYRRA